MCTCDEKEKKKEERRVCAGETRYAQQDIYGHVKQAYVEKNILKMSFAKRCFSFMKQMYLDIFLVCVFTRIHSLCF
jgi:hypothetical protein